MKINYTNQLQRNIMKEENFHCMPDNEQPTQEQSILSIEDAAKEHSIKVWGEYRYDVFKHNDIITDDSLGEITQKDFIAGANEMLPIIKELGEALKEIQEANTGGVINTHWMQNHIQTTLDKYKHLL